jgi:hypothetical protein
MSEPAMARPIARIKIIVAKSALDEFDIERAINRRSERPGGFPK